MTDNFTSVHIHFFKLKVYWESNTHFIQAIVYYDPELTPMILSG